MRPRLVSFAHRELPQPATVAPAELTLPANPSCRCAGVALLALKDAMAESPNIATRLVSWKPQGELRLPPPPAGCNSDRKPKAHAASRPRRSSAFQRPPDRAPSPRPSRRQPLPPQALGVPQLRQRARVLHVSGPRRRACACSVLCWRGRSLPSRPGRAAALAAGRSLTLPPLSPSLPLPAAATWPTCS